MENSGKTDLTREMPVLVGSTEDLFGRAPKDVAAGLGARREASPGVRILPKDRVHQELSNYFRSAQWSPDGTTILTSSADQTLKTFILPPDLLSSSNMDKLSPYSSYTLPSPAYATTIHPAYDLSSPSTALYLTSLSSFPIRLISPFAPGIVASYRLMNETTEAYIAPHSLLFDTYQSHGNTFFAGSDSEISVFDITRVGEGPINRMKTIPSRRKKMVGGGVGMKGLVSALSMSCEGLLAGGTFNRWVGLYDGGGRGGVVGVFGVREEEDDVLGVGEGAGITQVLWSNCGRYLCVVERGSNGIGVWDIRGTGRRLQWINGRHAETMQRLEVDLVGSSLYAGGTDGLIRSWESVGMSEGVVAPKWEFNAHDDTVSSTVMHPWGTFPLLASCSGQRHDATDEEDRSQPDNNLKIWLL